MKKICIIISCFFCFTSLTSAKSDIVTLSKCVDGDTARFILNQEEIKVRFLAVDTPELSSKDYYATEAKNFTCESLMNAKTIKLEYEESNKTDKYGRTLAWIFTDDNLLQKELVKNGYAKVAYLYDDYKYTELLQKEESLSKQNQLGIWGQTETKENNWYLYPVIGLISLLCFGGILSKTQAKKIIKKVSKK